MTEHAVPLSDVYQGWDHYQRDLLKAVTPLSPEQLALPVAPTHWPIGMLVQHIINDRIWWFDLWMGEGSPEVASFMHWEEERKIFGSSTRQDIIFHVLRHDMHHGGELAVGMGGYHLPTIWG